MRINPTPRDMDAVRSNFQILSKLLSDLGVSDSGTAIALWGQIGGLITGQIDLMSQFAERDAAIAIVQNNIDNYEEGDPVFLASEAANFEEGDKAKLDATDEAGEERPPEAHDVISKHITAELNSELVLRPDGQGGVIWAEPDVVTSAFHFDGLHSDSLVWAMTMNLGDSEAGGYEVIYDGGNAG